MRSLESLLAPTLTPTMPPAPARAASRDSTAAAPWLLKPSRLITAWSGSSRNSARTRIARLRQRRHGADFDKAEAQAQQRIGNLGVLVEAGRYSDRIGEIKPEGPHRQPRIAGRPAASGANLSALMVSEWASSGSSARSNGRARRSKKPINGRSGAKARRTLSAMTAFFKVGLDNSAVKAIIPMVGQ